MKIKKYHSKLSTLNLSAVISEINRNSLTIIIFIIISSGILTGTLNVSGNNELFQIFSYLYMQISSFRLEFYCKLLFCLIILSTNFIMGLCCVGKPIILICNLLTGIFSGSFIATIFTIKTESAISSISNIIYIICMLVLCIYSSEISCNLSQKITYKVMLNKMTDYKLKIYLKSYLILMIVGTIVCLVTSVFQ